MGYEIGFSFATLLRYAVCLLMGEQLRQPENGIYALL